MTKIVVYLTDEQAEQFRSAIEVLEPVKVHDSFEDMTNGLIEEFCRDMGVGWKYGHVTEDEQEQNNG